MRDVLQRAPVEEDHEGAEEMKLQDRLPEGVEVDGKWYKLDLDFRNVLRMIEVLDRDDLMPEAKAYILPSVKGTSALPRRTMMALMERVKAGAVLSLSLDDCLLSPFTE